MLRSILLAAGCLLLLLQNFILQVSTTAQFIVFIAGIFFLGIPHGAADLLVAAQNSGGNKRSFSRFRFLVKYISGLSSFAAVLWCFPVTGILLFILFAAYHFGETDLYQFKTNTVLGKIFVMAYGLLILAIILLHHFEEVKPILQSFPSGKENAVLLNWLDAKRYNIISISGIFFFSTTFLYFYKYRDTGTHHKGDFLIRFAIILFILFNLPMLLGFSFYFVIWHSLLSLKNIITYLRNNKSCTPGHIIRQVLLYSGLALIGMSVFGMAAFMFISSQALIGHLLLGLAVLTAPHMQVMHDMYNRVRLTATQ